MSVVLLFGKEPYRVNYVVNQKFEQKLEHVEYVQYFEI